MSPVQTLIDAVTKHRSTHLKDRRDNGRQDFNTTIQYKMSDMPTFGEGQLHNFSRTGVLITIPRTLNINSDILLVIPTKGQHQLPVHVSCRVARKAGSDSCADYTYGCKIEMIHDAEDLIPVH